MVNSVLKKSILTLLLLSAWAVGASLTAGPAPWQGPNLFAFDCCRVSPLHRVVVTFNDRTQPQVHSGSAPCCDLPLGPESLLTSYQRPDSQLPDSPGQFIVTLHGRRHYLFAASNPGFVPHSSPVENPALALLETVVLLN